MESKANVFIYKQAATPVLSVGDVTSLCVRFNGPVMGDIRERSASIKISFLLYLIYQRSFHHQLCCFTSVSSILSGLYNFFYEQKS
jgi:hypothetical protein